MKEELVFQERQYFKRWKAAIFFIFLNTPFIHVFVIHNGFREQYGDYQASNIVLILITLITFLFSLVFFFVRLDTVIDRDGVYVQMFPVQWKFNFTPWDHIREAGIKKIHSIERGSFGFLPTFKKSFVQLGRSGIQMRSLMAIVSGNKTLQLVMLNNKKKVIGTQRPEELSEFLEKLDAERKQK